MIILYISVSCEASEGVCVVYPNTESRSASEYIHNALYSVVNNSISTNNTGRCNKFTPVKGLLSQAKR